jgi:branched-chain amino acid transport system permease protein
VSNAFFQSIINGVFLGSLYGLIAMGLAIIFGVVRVVNLAHGDFLMLSMYISYLTYKILGLDPYLSIFISIPALYGVGVLLFKFFIGPVEKRKGPHTNMLMITYGAGLLMANGCLLAFSPTYRSVTPSYANSTLSVFGISIGLVPFIGFMVAVGAVVLMGYMLKNSELGRQIRAVSDNHEAAELVGINTDRISAISVGMGAASCALAGVVFAPMYYVHPGVGGAFTIKSFVVVVLGGLGSIPGALLGGIILGIVESLGAFYVSYAYKDIMGFILFLCIMIYRPHGLLGKPIKFFKHG